MIKDSKNPLDTVWNYHACPLVNREAIKWQIYNIRMSNSNHRTFYIGFNLYKANLI